MEVKVNLVGYRIIIRWLSVHNSFFFLTLHGVLSSLGSVARVVVIPFSCASGSLHRCVLLL